MIVAPMKVPIIERGEEAPKQNPSGTAKAFRDKSGKIKRLRPIRHIDQELPANESAQNAYLSTSVQVIKKDPHKERIPAG